MNQLGGIELAEKLRRLANQLQGRARTEQRDLIYQAADVLNTLTEQRGLPDDPDERGAILTAGQGWERLQREQVERGRDRLLEVVTELAGLAPDNDDRPERDFVDQLANDARTALAELDGLRPPLVTEQGGEQEKSLRQALNDGDIEAVRAHNRRREQGGEGAELESAAHAVLDAVSFLSLRDALGHDRRAMNEGWESLRVVAERLDALLPDRSTLPAPESGASGDGEHKLIPLYSKGHPAGHTKVDADDFDRLNGYRWRLHARGYVVRGSRPGVLMHREIMGLPSQKGHAHKGHSPEVDHINGDKLDNRRVNLRVVDRATNIQNREGFGTSSVKGVFLDSVRQKWTAMDQKNRKKVLVGRFDTEDEAVAALRAYEATLATTKKQDSELANLVLTYFTAEELHPDEEKETKDEMLELAQEIAALVGGDPERITVSLTRDQAEGLISASELDHNYRAALSPRQIAAYMGGRDKLNAALRGDG